MKLAGIAKPRQDIIDKLDFNNDQGVRYEEYFQLMWGHKSAANWRAKLKSLGYPSELVEVIRTKKAGALLLIMSVEESGKEIDLPESA